MKLDKLGTRIDKLFIVTNGYTHAHTLHSSRTRMVKSTNILPLPVTIQHQRSHLIQRWMHTCTVMATGDCFVKINGLKMFEYCGKCAQSVSVNK